MKTEEKVKCPYEKKCGGCKYQGIPYEKQLKEKEKKVRKLLKDYGKPEPILGMEDPYYYRNKVHATYNENRNRCSCPQDNSLFLQFGDLFSNLFSRIIQTALYSIYAAV